MSYQDQPGGAYPPPPRPNESQYPPPPDDDDRARAYHQRGPSGGVTLPSISPYDPQYAQPNGYPPDPRAYGRPDPYRDMHPGAYGRDDRMPYPMDYGRAPPQMNFSQSAPRQRTAIACRYCRRRKIRCSGFETNAQGRCSNCQRFNQDCIFTPVSSQAQAFVPAHAAYPHMRNVQLGPDGRPRVYPEQQLYGAHGQPLGTIPPPPPAAQYQEYAMPSPTGSYNAYMDDRVEAGRKRLQQEPHQPVLPPPVPPGQMPQYPRGGEIPRRPAAEDEYRLPPVTPTPSAGPTNSNYSPVSSTSSTSGIPVRPKQESGLPSLSRTPPPRSSPGESQRQDPMSLGSIMENRPDTNIDKNMLSRLNRKG